MASANASLNGVGLSGQPAGNMEAGMFFATNTDGWRETKLLFHQLWKSPVIDKVQLARAPKSAADPGKRISDVGQLDPSLLRRVKSYPDEFASVLFIAENEHIDPKDEAKVRVHYEAAKRAGTFEPKSRSLILNADHDTFPPIPGNVIMFWRDGRGARVEVFAYSSVVAVRSRKSTTLWGVKRWDRFWSGQGVKPPEGAVSLMRTRLWLTH